MKPLLANLKLTLSLVSALLLSRAVVQAAPPQPAASPSAPAATNAVEEIPQSVFLVYSPTQTLRDPFFPDSSRRPAAAPVSVTPTKTAPSASIDLKLQAIFGAADRPFATINSTTFELGEERELTTPAGRIKVRCVDIRLEDEAVIVEAAGTRQELRFPTRK